MSKDRIDLKKHIREVPDWPRKGILFYDITPLLGDAGAFRVAVDAMAADYAVAGRQLTLDTVIYSGKIKGGTLGNNNRSGSCICGILTVGRCGWPAIRTYRS